MKIPFLHASGELPVSGWRRFADRRLPNIVVFLMVATFVAAVLYPYTVVTVTSGHVGVLWKRFGGPAFHCWCFVGRGTVLDPRELREEGFHLIFPWNKLFVYDLRLQTMSQSYDAISSDGVGLRATISTRFQLKHDSMAQLHKFIGPDYSETVVQPEIGSRAREIIARYTAEQVYLARQEIEQKIRFDVQNRLGQRLNDLVQTQSSDQFDPAKSEDPATPDLSQAIQIFDTLILGLQLPDPVVGAINRKVEQLYLSQEYDFRIERERKEALRKQIEATGIRDFQQTVSQGISDSYLRWRGIEATLQLSQSNNAKIVIVGGGKDGLPIILGNMDTATHTPAAETPAAGRPAPAPDIQPEDRPAPEKPAPAMPGGAPTRPQTLLERGLWTLDTVLSPFAGRKEPQSPWATR